MLTGGIYVKWFMGLKFKLQLKRRQSIKKNWFTR